MDFPANPQSRDRSFLLPVGFVLIFVIGLVDYLTGYELSFSVFYVLPIALVTWTSGRRPGLAAAFASAMVWFAADLFPGHSYSHPLIPVWNSLIRLSFFVIITLLLSALGRATERERELARKDYLTGAVNSRFFFQLARMEIDRSERYGHPFTLACIDLDNFKTVNDRFGHGAGDAVLRTVVETAGKSLRKTDVIARLGGDEFALLMPETDLESARLAIEKVRGELLGEMGRNGWPVTFSIGVLICGSSPATVEELVKMADGLMYQVKHESKNAVKYSAYPG